MDTSVTPFDWDDWVDFMEANHNVQVPSHIEFKPNRDSQSFTKKNLEVATLDELGSAIAQLDEEIQRLKEVRTGLLEVTNRARKDLNSGSMSVYEALFGEPEKQF